MSTDDANLTPKPTRAEVTARKLRSVRSMLDQRAHPADIKRAFAKQFKCSPRAAERFITDACEQIRLETGRPLAEHRQNAYAFYTRIVSDMTLPIRERIRAQENIDKIMGTAAAVKYANTDSTGNDIPPPARRTFEDVLAEINAAVAETAPGVE